MSRTFARQIPTYVALLKLALVISIGLQAHDQALALAPLEEVVVTGAVVERPEGDQTTFVGILEEVQEQIALEHAAQLLNQLPGVWLHRNNGQEMLTSIRSPVFTGPGACGAFWVGEQGVALRSAGFCNVNQLFEAHTEAAKAVTVFKGPHSSYHGSNAQFGSIHVQLPLADEISPSLALTASDRGFRQLHTRFRRLRQGSHSLGALVTLKEDDAWRESSGYKQQKATLSHRWQHQWTSVDSQLTVVNLEQETAAFVEGENAYRDRGLRKQNTAPQAYRDAQAVRFQSHIRTRAVDKEWTITPYARSTRMDFLMHFLPWQPTEENGHDAFGIKVLRKRYWAGGLDTYFGVEAEYTNGFLTEIQNAPAPFGQDRFPEGVHYDYEVNARHVAAFAGVYAPVLRTPLSLDVGLRYDIDKYDYDNRTESGSACADGVVGCRFFRPEDRTDNFNNGSAHMGVRYTSAPEIPEFFIRWSRGFRLPQTSELYRAQSDSELFADEEKIKAWEIGVHYDREAFTGTLALFHMRNRDGIFQDSQRLYVNSAHTDHRGIEYAVAYGWLDKRLNLALSGTVAKHRYRNNPSRLGGSETVTIEGNRVDSAPSDIHRLTLSWEDEAWRHALTVDDLGAYYLDAENSQRYPGHTLVGFQTQWQANKAWRWRFGASNLTDRLAADRADVAFGTQRYFPAAPRTFYLGVSVSLD